MQCTFDVWFLYKLHIHPGKGVESIFHTSEFLVAKVNILLLSGLFLIVFALRIVGILFNQIRADSGKSCKIKLHFRSA